MTPHPRILRRRLDVALCSARTTCLAQVEALHESLAVLGRNGFEQAGAYQAMLLEQRAALIALDPADEDAGPAIMAQALAICTTMEEAMRALRDFLGPAADHTTLVSPPST